VQARPFLVFGRPVHPRDGSLRLRPGGSPQALQTPPRGGRPALRCYFTSAREALPPRSDIDPGSRVEWDFNPPETPAARHTIWDCLTSHVRSSLSCSLGIHSADRGAIRHGQTQDLPVPVRKASVRAQGLRPRGAITSLAISICYVLPSVHLDAVGTPKLTCFRGSIPGLHVPLPTLRAPPYGSTRMARGQCDSLCLHCMKLSFTTFRRF